MGLDADDGRPGKLQEFLDQIVLWNPRYKLVASGEDLITRHLLDSLAALEIIRGLTPARMADIGSGAGFPGIPLAICMEDTEVSLIERSGRRAGFLRNAVVSLGLTNLAVLEKPAEEASDDGPFDVVTFRAWSRLDEVLLDTVTPLLTPGGVIAAYKGLRSVAERETAAALRGLDHVAIHPLKVPGLDEERCLAVIKPVSPGRGRNRSRWI